MKSTDSAEHQILTSALVGVLVFLEFSNESVNPDSAVAAMENVSARLRMLSDDERRRFVDRVRVLAADYPEGELRDFVLNLGDSLGLTD